MKQKVSLNGEVYKIIKLYDACFLKKKNHPNPTPNRDTNITLLHALLMCIKFIIMDSNSSTCKLIVVT